MRLLNKLCGFDRRSSEWQYSLNDPALKALFGGEVTASGQVINERNALKISAVYSCVNSIAQTVATMPFLTYRRLEGGGKSRAENHPVFRLLKTRPNGFMTSVSLRQTMEAHVLLWGNAFAFIERDQAGRVMNLWPWHPSRVRIQWKDGRLWYYYTPPGGGEIQFPQESVLHIRNLSDDGIVGYSVISLHRESLGLCQASVEYRARFFKNDARPGGVLRHPGTLSDQAFSRLKEDFSAARLGENRRTFAILEEGLDWKDVGIPPNDAQFIEGWQAGKEDIAGIFRVPPYKIGIMKPGTVSHSSVEQSNLDFWTDCILWWATVWEQTCDVALFTEAEQRIYFVEMLADNMLRADSKTRAETLQIWRRNGIINADEWLAIENRNPLPGDQGKTYIVEGNMTRLDQVGRMSAPAPRPAQEPPPA